MKKYEITNILEKITTSEHFCRYIVIKTKRCETETYKKYQHLNWYLNKQQNFQFQLDDNLNFFSKI